MQLANGSPEPRLPWVVRLAGGACRMLLRSFPGRFRRRHATPLLQNATDLLTEAHAESGALAVLLLGPRLARNLVAGGLVERARGGPHPLDRFASQLRWNPGS